MTYFDVFVRAVPTANRERYRQHGDAAAAVFREYGALQVVECWGDDVPEGEKTSLQKPVKKQDDETVVFGWILWPSHEARDEGRPKAMADARLSEEANPMPFDGSRLIYGGFETIVER